MSKGCCETAVEVVPEWTDQNGHMNVAYYVLAFDRATDAFYDELGIGWSYRGREDRSMFTLSMNVDYLREVFAGNTVRIESRLIECDRKRVRYFHRMYHATQGYLAATNECLAIHVNMTTRRSEAFSDALRARLEQACTDHATGELAPQLGRVLALHRG